MVRLYDKETGAFLGTITDEPLRLMQDLLEEESEDDTDYYISADTLDMFAAPRHSSRWRSSGQIGRQRNAVR